MTNEQKARVTVKREHAIYGCAGIIDVYVDGVKLGGVANASKASFEIEAGKHCFESRFMGFETTDRTPFEIQAGEHIEICLRFYGSVLLATIFPFLYLTKKYRKFAVVINKCCGDKMMSQEKPAFETGGDKMMCQEKPAFETGGDKMMNQEKPAFETSIFIVLLVVTFFIPVIGIVVGAMNLKSPERNVQSCILLSAGLLAALYNMGTLLAYLG